MNSTEQNVEAVLEESLEPGHQLWAHPVVDGRTETRVSFCELCVLHAFLVDNQEH